MKEQEKKKVGVVGARGYSGLELARLLLKHPQTELRACFATSDFRLGDYLPERTARAVPSLAMEELMPILERRALDTVFLATPHAVSLSLASKLLEYGVDVIDLSGAFRLQEGHVERRLANYMKWYNLEHTAPALLNRAQYGLSPWIDIAKPAAEPALIANPGCYATAVLMALVPLLKSGLIEPNSLVIDAKSGTTGAGRKAEERLLHAEVDGLCLPYRVGVHQHEPEIRQFATALSGVAIDPHFSTSLLNTRRGIVAGLYARLTDDARARLAHAGAEKTLDDVYASAYAGYPLVEFGALPKADALLNLRRVVGSPRTLISYRAVGDKLYVFSLIDNLLKGAASQAIENFNRLNGQPSWLGLSEVEGVL